VFVGCAYIYQEEKETDFIFLVTGIAGVRILRLI